MTLTFATLILASGVFSFLDWGVAACFAVLAVGVAHIDALWVESDAIWENA